MWRKSGRSGADCVEVNEWLQVRDSKTQRAVLQVTRKFFNNIKKGWYDIG